MKNQYSEKLPVAFNLVTQVLKETAGHLHLFQERYKMDLIRNSSINISAVVFTLECNQAALQQVTTWMYEAYSFKEILFYFNHTFNDGILAGLMFVYKKKNPSNPVIKYPFYSQSIFRVVVVVFLETGSL